MPDLQPNTPTPAPNRPRRARRRRFKLVAVLGTLLVLLLAGEGALRIKRAIETRRLRAALSNAGNEASTGWAIFDPDLHYRNRPSWRDHNADGMRDRPTPPKEKFRVLMIGDSLGYYGDPIDDTYPNRLEALLAADPQCAPCDVLAAQTKGYTNYQEVAYLKKFGFDFLPDLIGIGVCVNDFHRFLHEFEVADGRIVAHTYSISREAKESLTSGSPIGFLRRRSLCIDWLARNAALAAAAVNLHDRYAFDVRPDVNTAWRDSAWNRVDAQMNDAAEQCRRRKIPMFVVMFPYGAQYRESYLARDRDYVLKPQRKLRELCSRLQVPMLDLYDEIAGAANLEDDGIHLTPRGREIVAASIHRFLMRHGLIPPRPHRTDSGSTGGR